MSTASSSSLCQCRSRQDRQWLASDLPSSRNGRSCTRSKIYAAAFIQVLEVLDSSFPGDATSLDSSSERDSDGYARFDPDRGLSLHRPWPRLYQTAGSSPSGVVWPSLSAGSGGASWCQEGPQSRRGRDGRTVRGRQGRAGPCRVSKAPPSLESCAVEPAPQDPARSSRDATGCVKTIAKVQALGRWSQVRNVSQSNEREHLLFVLEREKIGAALAGGTRCCAWPRSRSVPPKTRLQFCRPKQFTVWKAQCSKPCHSAAQQAPLTQVFLPSRLCSLPPRCRHPMKGRPSSTRHVAQHQTACNKE
jgi:hypothetical protein